MHSLLHAQLANTQHADALSTAQRRRDAEVAAVETAPPASSSPQRPNSTLGRLAGALGGACWIAYALLANARPTGCTGDACLIGLERHTGDLDGLLIGGLLLIILALQQFAVRRANRTGRALLLAGGIATTAGISVALLGGATASALGSDSVAWRAFVDPGMLAVVVGFGLTGAGFIRARLLPGPVGALVTLGALALTAANDQDERVLLLIPFALGVLAASAIGLRAPSREREAPFAAPVR